MSTTARGDGPGRNQAAQLPDEFRLPGDGVRPVGDAVRLEPVATDAEARFAGLDRFADVPFLDDGRNQPPMPGAEDVFG